MSRLGVPLARDFTGCALRAQIGVQQFAHPLVRFASLSEPKLRGSLKKRLDNLYFIRILYFVNQISNIL